MTDDNYGFYGPGLIDPLDIIAKHEATIEWLRADNTRLRDENSELVIEGYKRDTQTIVESTADLLARIAELEAHVAIARGSLAPTPAPDEPVTITHDVPPNAPR